MGKNVIGSHLELFHYVNPQDALSKVLENISHIQLSRSGIR